jgi:hypothetical protein
LRKHKKKIGAKPVLYFIWKDGRTHIQLRKKGRFFQEVISDLQILRKIDKIRKAEKKRRREQLIKEYLKKEEHPPLEEDYE